MAENDIDNIALSVDVEEAVMDRVRSGETTHIVIDLNERNQNLILHSSEGALMLVTKKLPTKWHGCHYYNRGRFPYAIKESLDFLVLNDGEEHCLTKIIDITPVAGTRFRFKGPGQPSVEDPKGDSCIWEIQFEIVPVPEEPRYYLMRWNPTISSFTESDYQQCLAHQKHGMFRLNWSIYDWQEARRGDFFYMMRTGDDKAGIVFTGQLLSDPYPGDDWAGSTRRRMYVDMVCINLEPERVLTFDQLQQAVPQYEWSKGHSGALLSKDIIEKLEQLWDEKNDDDQ